MGRGRTSKLIKKRKKIITTWLILCLHYASNRKASLLPLFALVAKTQHNQAATFFDVTEFTIAANSGPYITSIQNSHHHKEKKERNIKYLTTFVYFQNSGQTFVLKYFKEKSWK